MVSDTGSLKGLFSSKEAGLIPKTHSSANLFAEMEARKMPLNVLQNNKSKKVLDVAKGGRHHSQIIA